MVNQVNQAGKLTNVSGSSITLRLCSQGRGLILSLLEKRYSGNRPVWGVPLDFCDVPLGQGLKSDGTEHCEKREKAQGVKILGGLSRFLFGGQA